MNGATRLIFGPLLAALLLLPATPGGAQGDSAADLEKACQEPAGRPEALDIYLTGLCTGYMLGMLSFKSIAPDYASLYCLPPATRVTVDQVRRVFLRFMAEHPQHLSQPAVGALVMALAAAFPCRP